MKVTNPRQTLADNLAHLMKAEKLSQAKLAARSGVAQHTISDIMNQKSAATLDTVSTLAAAFGLDMWHLLMPGLPDELKKSEAVPRLYANYARASEEGRRYIEIAAEREAAYSQKPAKK